MTGLAIAGLAIAGYLLAVRLLGEAPACGPVAGCDTVAASEYATVIGLPVALYGVVFSIVLLSRLPRLVARRAAVGPVPRLRAGAGRHHRGRLPDLPRDRRDRGDLRLVRDVRPHGRRRLDPGRHRGHARWSPGLTAPSARPFTTVLHRRYGRRNGTIEPGASRPPPADTWRAMTINLLRGKGTRGAKTQELVGRGDRRVRCQRLQLSRLLRGRSPTGPPGARPAASA